MLFSVLYIVNHIRIGMNDIAEEGVYIWEDGSPVTHVRYTPGEPGDAEDCMALFVEDGGFADVVCTGWAGYFICETDYNTL